MLTQQATKTYRLVGITKFGSADSPLGASVTAFTLHEAQTINNYTDQITSVRAVAEPGVSQTELQRRVEQAVKTSDPLTAADAEVITGKQLTEENQNDIQDALGFFNIALLVFAVVALFVAVFIIYNTFSIILAQRLRELALLRAIGAGTPQVFGSVMFESFAIGLVAAILGFVAGIGLAVGLKNLLNVLGFGIPATSIVIPSTAIIASIIVGIGVTMLSALLPAWKAARVPPIAALRDVAFERSSGLARRALAGGIILFLGAATLLYGLFGGPSNAIAFVGLGAGVMFIGVFVIAPLLSRPVGLILGAPHRIFGVSGALARENAMRSPRRTARTAAALMIGVSLVGFITIFAASAKESIAHAVDQQLKSDYILTGGTGFTSIFFSPTVGEEVAKIPEFFAVSPVRIGEVRVEGKSEFITSSDPKPSEELIDFDVIEGAIGDLTDDGVAISEDYSDDHDLGMGDVVSMEFPDGAVVPLHVQAIYTRTQLAGDFLTSIGLYEQHFLPTQQLDFLVMAKLAPGADAKAAVAQMEKIVEPYPTVEIRDNEQYKKDQAASINQVVNIVYAMLFLSIIIAFIGIVITLALSIYERTRELGLLRAVGMSRRQMRRTVRLESVLIALFGTALGLVVGLFFGYAVFLALRDEGFNRFAAAPGQLLIVVIVSVFVGIAAAIYPARRAARLDILESIATE
ncbi:MAG TPA: ABC transporter permease [Acidimicrobiia bacterium]|nr:ABC transporter permease [Acidimicrobiia bacterium]